MPNIMLWAEKITGEPTERAEKSAQSMLNIMTWAEKNAGKATERAEKSAQSMLNTMIWAEKQQKKQLNIPKSLPKAYQI